MDLWCYLKKKLRGWLGGLLHTKLQVFKATDNDNYLVTNYLKRWLYLNSFVWHIFDPKSLGRWPTFSRSGPWSSSSTLSGTPFYSLDCRGKRSSRRSRCPWPRSRFGKAGASCKWSGGSFRVGRLRLETFDDDYFTCCIIKSVFSTIINKVTKTLLNWIQKCYTISKGLLIESTSKVVCIMNVQLSTSKKIISNKIITWKWGNSQLLDQLTSLLFERMRTKETRKQTSQGRMSSHKCRIMGQPLWSDAWHQRFQDVSWATF